MLLKTYAGINPGRSGAFRISFKVFIFLSVFALGFSSIPWLPAPGVVAEIRFNEGTGTIAADVSGNGYNGTLVNGPTWGTGKYGQGLNLDGVNDYVNIADNASFTLTP